MGQETILEGDKSVFSPFQNTVAAASPTSTLHWTIEQHSYFLLPFAGHKSFNVSGVDRASLTYLEWWLSAQLSLFISI